MSDETALPVERWTYPVVIAASASWRLVVTVGVITAVPASAVSFLLVSIGLPPGASFLPVLAATFFALSYFFHELGHAVCLWWVAGRAGGAREMLADGTFTSARVVRWSQGDDADALVSIVGPVTGIAVGFPILLPLWPFVMSFPFFCLFLIHVASLAPRYSDGKQLFASFSEWSSRARRG